MNKKLIKILKSLGYRFPQSSKEGMLKTFGFHVMKIHAVDGEIYFANHFYGDGIVKDLLCWNSINIDTDGDEGDIKRRICEAEAYTNISSGRYVDFTFSTENERLEYMLEGTGLV